MANVQDTGPICIYEIEQDMSNALKKFNLLRDGKKKKKICINNYNVGQKLLSKVQSKYSGNAEERKVPCC